MAVGDSGSRAGATRPGWNHHPDLSIRPAPFRDRPFRFGAVARYVISGWSPFGERLHFLLIAIGVRAFFSPAPERCVEFRADWIFEIRLRNVRLPSVVAGGPRLRLYAFRGQGDDTRHDGRACPATNENFPFGDQLRENVFWSLTTGAAVWTACEALPMRACANGPRTMISLDDDPVRFVPPILIVPYRAGFRFYARRRLMHRPPLFEHVHRHHHENVNPGPWSGLSRHAVDFGDRLIFLVVPSHPVHAVFNPPFHGVGAPSFHTGHDGARPWKGRKPRIGDFLHHPHHRRHDRDDDACDAPWDRLFGGFHAGAEEGDRLIAARCRARRKRAAA